MILEGFMQSDTAKHLRDDWCMEELNNQHPSVQSSANNNKWSRLVQSRQDVPGLA